MSEIVVGAVAVLLVVPTLYVTLKASAMALRGEEIGRPAAPTCTRCKWFRQNVKLVKNKGLFPYCDALGVASPAQKANKNNDCKLWEAR